MTERRFKALLRCDGCGEPLLLRDEKSTDFSTTYISLSGMKWCITCSVVVLGIDLMPRFLLFAAGLTDNVGMGSN